MLNCYIFRCPAFSALTEETLLFMDGNQCDIYWACTKGEPKRYLQSAHCKKRFDINSNYLSLLKSRYIVRNKDDLYSFIKLSLRFWSL